MERKAVMYLLANLSTTGGTTSKIYSTLDYSKYNIFIVAKKEVISENFESLWLRHSNCNIIWLNSRKHIIKNLIMLCRVIRQNNIKIIHVFFPFETYITFLLKLLNPSLIIIRSFEGNVNRKLVIKLLSRLVLPHFNMCIFISKYVENFYKQKFNIKKGIILFNSAGHVCKYQIKTSVKGKCHLLSVAGLNIMKNVFMYVEIAKVLRQRGFNFDLTILGDGPLYESLKRKIKDNHLDENVFLLGNINNPIPYYESSDIYIHPADKEGFGIVVAEALSSGTPVVVSNVGGVVETVEDKVSGLIVDAYDAEEWANAIIKLSVDNDLYSSLSKNGYLRYKNLFTPMRYSQSLDFLYSSLIQ